MASRPDKRKARLAETDATGRSSPAGPALPKGVYVGIQSRGGLALPADMRKRHHLDQPGAQVLVIERDDGVLELHPQAAVPADQQWFWTQKWQAAEHEVDEHLAAGEATVHADADDLFDHLDALRDAT